MQGIIFDIQRFSVHDGPGIRTTVFFKGCNNHCQWCHNPESLSARPELQFFSERCIGCKHCFGACPTEAHQLKEGERQFHRERCTACGRCAGECFSNALRIVGKQMTTAEVLAEVLADKVYYDHSGGGVTLSGGEPLLQTKFAKEILMACQADQIHAAIQTAGNYSFDRLAELLPYTDLVMYDFKVFAEDLHAKYIGSGYQRIRGNLLALSEQNVKLVVRTPIIGGINDNTEEISKIAWFIKDFKHLLYYQLIPYHRMGEDKVERLGKEERSSFFVPAKVTMERLAQVASACVPDVRSS